MKYVGPMAQDFYAAFGQDAVGRVGDDTSINSSDLSGILMVAVQALEKRTAELTTQNEELQTRLQEQEALKERELQARAQEQELLKKRLEKLEQFLGATTGG